MDYRVGIGNDMHRLKCGKGIRIGGITIPSHFAAVAVSDGDVLMHAIVDALLGALGLGDIGEHFPESAVARGTDSRRFVDAVLAMPEFFGVKVINLDCIIELERPRLSEWKSAIRMETAGVLGIEPARVNIKAKTSEGLGPIGESQAVAARVAVLLGISDMRST